MNYWKHYLIGFSVPDALRPFIFEGNFVLCIVMQQCFFFRLQSVTYLKNLHMFRIKNVISKFLSPPPKYTK